MGFRIHTEFFYAEESEIRTIENMLASKEVFRSRKQTKSTPRGVGEMQESFEDAGSIGGHLMVPTTRPQLGRNQTSLFLVTE
jgi:hypothetical protein